MDAFAENWQRSISSRRHEKTKQKHLASHVADLEDADVISLFDADASGRSDRFGFDGDVVAIPRDPRRRIATDVALESNRFARLGDFVVRYRIEFGRHFAHSALLLLLLLLLSRCFYFESQ